MGYVVVKFRKTGDVHVVGDADGQTERIWRKHNAKKWNRETNNLVDLKFFDEEDDAKAYAYPEKKAAASKGAEKPAGNKKGGK